ncbi:MAG: BtpA/SgcQ family protein [Bacteroidia bacterium]|nr:BtpA/SgcQ family protein [Bacteroidia bacterium]
MTSPRYSRIPFFPKTQCPLIGMVHLRALPGTPAWEGNFSSVLRSAVEEAILLKKEGIDGLLLENMHDTPYLRREVGPEIVASMAVIAARIKAETGLPTGIQILAGANKAALAVAQAAGLEFIRAEGFVFSHIADEGQMDSDAGELLRYRRQIGAEEILIFTDIKKKHSAHAITADLDILETAKAAAFFRSDGVIITGNSTGHPAKGQEVQVVRKEVEMPVLVGSGVTADNLVDYFSNCDGVIVGSVLKEKGHWANEISREKVEELVARANSLRNKK